MLVTLFCSEPKKDIREKQPESQPELQPESLRIRVLGLLVKGELSKSEISVRLGQKEISGQLNIVIRDLLKEKVIGLTIPEKPTSSKQKYRLTEIGKLFLKGS